MSNVLKFLLLFTHPCQKRSWTFIETVSPLKGEGSVAECSRMLNMSKNGLTACILKLATKISLFIFALLPNWGAIPL